jgi:acyl-CoA thioester hydrolase
MPPEPIIFRTRHRVRFSVLDPYNHMSTAHYATYYVDHRMEGLRDNIGWDAKTLTELPFLVWVRRLEIDFIRPVGPDQEVTITSFVKEFRGPDALIKCEMLDPGGKQLSRCVMTVAYVDRADRRARDWPPDVAALFFK